jgi:hypothetical protein
MVVIKMEYNVCVYNTLARVMEAFKITLNNTYV